MTSNQLPGMPDTEFVLYQTEDGLTRIQVRASNETVWLSLDQMAELFQRDKSTISRHISNVFSEGELDNDSTVADFATVQTEGTRTVSRQVTYYTLDVIISVGYRVKSLRGTQFRRWALGVLKEYLVKGFSMNDDLLKQAGGGGYWRELLERIRDIRSSEKVLYRQVLDLYATSVDYDPRTSESQKFFAIVQNKLHFAAHGHTAAEVIASRADATRPNMGLTSFAGNRPRKSDVTVAKNYLSEPELKKLNTLVSAYFDAAEFRAQNHEPTYMKDWLAHLDRLITAMDAPTLAGAGSVSHDQAVSMAEGEYEQYRRRIADEPSPVETDYLESLKAVQRQIAGKDTPSGK